MVYFRIGSCGFSFIVFAISFIEIIWSALEISLLGRGEFILKILKHEMGGKNYLSQEAQV